MRSADLTPVFEAPLHLNRLVLDEVDVLAFDYTSIERVLAAWAGIAHSWILGELHDHPL